MSAREFTSFTPELVEILQGGGVAVLKTDTLYGIVARADDKAAVDKVYQLKGRAPAKQSIVLISSIMQLYDEYTPDMYERLHNFWPGANSIILNAETAPEWLTQDTKTLAYRLPAYKELRDLIEQTGPLIAPSANPEGSQPASTIDEAKSYFGLAVDAYVDGGPVQDVEPSKLFRLTPEGAERLR